MNSIIRTLLVTLLLVSAAASSQADLVDPYDPERALAISQAAIGHIIADHQFIDRMNRKVRISDYAGKPLIISMIFTSCHHVCPMITKHLDKASKVAREVLGEDSFEIVTIGFDAARDTPDAMQAFAREQSVNGAGWAFLSGSEETIEALSKDLGFIFFPSPRGFDHINQVTVIDRNRTVYSQVYGATFELPWLVEPLKQLVFNRPEATGHFVSSLADRVRLFCTVYNPSSGRYEFDYSLFIQMAVGLMAILSVVVFLWRGSRPPRKT